MQSLQKSPLIWKCDEIFFPYFIKKAWQLSGLVAASSWQLYMTMKLAEENSLWKWYADAFGLVNIFLKYNHSSLISDAQNLAVKKHDQKCYSSVEDRSSLQSKQRRNKIR